MDIRLSVFPTDLYPRLIAYTSEYKIRDSLGLQFRVLLYDYPQHSDAAFPYQIMMDDHIRYLPYDRGRAVEKLLDYISRREEQRIYE